MTKFMFDCKVEYVYELFESCKYPWEILPRIKDRAEKLVAEGMLEFSYLTEGIMIGKNVEIAENVTIIPPAVIGEGTVLRPGAYLRGNVITGRNCVIGNSSELKNCLLLDNVQLPHYNYVGDSILGNGVHLGASAICSNLKSDGTNVRIHAHIDFETGLRKVGAFLADGADIGSGCILNPGTVIGKNTSVYPLTSLRGVFPADCIVKSTDNIVIRKEVL